MAYIVSAATSFPPQYYSQEVLATVLRKYFLSANLDFDLESIDRFFTNVMINGRYFTLPLDSFYDPPTPGAAVRATIEAALGLAEKSVSGVLDKVGLAPQDINQLTSVTLTAAVPSIEARLMNRIPFSPFVKRVPLFGYGCMGGAAGIARVADYLRGHPDEAAIVFSVEISSALWQGSIQRELYTMIQQLPEDPSQRGNILMTIITAALFGDGSGATLMVGPNHPLAKPGKPRVIDTRSIWLPNTIDLMGMDIVDTGFRNILRPQVGEYVRVGLRKALDPLLDDYNLSIEKISRWILHPGGPKVLDAVEAEFGLPDHTLKLSRDTLAAVGNLSSATVLYMLNETLKEEPPPPGAYGLLIAMGPGFSQEIILLQW